MYQRWALFINMFRRQIQKGKRILFYGICEAYAHLLYAVIDPYDVFFLQFVSDPCASNPCHHGNCSTSSDGYLCICSEGYEGTNCEHSFRSLPASEPMEPLPPSQSRPVSSTLEPDIVLPHSRATVTLPTWQPKAGQKVVDLKWDEIEVRVFCLSKNTQKGTSECYRCWVVICAWRHGSLHEKGWRYGLCLELIFW